MVRIRVRGLGMHYAYESPPEDRSRRGCICVLN